MKNTRTTMRRAGLALAGLLAITLTTDAKKPPKDPPPPEPSAVTGIVYAEFYPSFWAINADGSGGEILFNLPNDVFFHEPSELRHNGERWFAAWQEKQPGLPDWRLVAVSESGEVVPLCEDPMPAPLWVGGIMTGPRWMPADAGLYWPGFVRDEEGAIVGGAIYTLDVGFTAGGPISTGEASLLEWTAGMFEARDDLGETCLWVEACDLSPDGTAIVYWLHGDDADLADELFLGDSTGATQSLATDDGSRFPAAVRWSPDGTRIAFSIDDGARIDVIDLPAWERWTAVAPNKGTVYLPVWSPESTHLVYKWVTTVGPRIQKINSSLRVVVADGTGDTELTRPSSETSTLQLGWRAAGP